MSYYIKAIHGVYRSEYEFRTLDEAKEKARELLEAGSERVEYGEKQVRVETTILGILCAR